MTDLNGNANEEVPIPLVFEYRNTGGGVSLLANGGFEGGLQGWGSGGSVEVDTLANTGMKALRINSDSFVFQTGSVGELTNYVYSGRVVSSGGLLPVEVGVSFWDANGVWVGDEVMPVVPGSEFETFTLEFTAPLGTDTATVWVLTERGASVVIDDLFLSVGGEGSPPVDGYGGENLLLNGGFEEELFWWDFGSSNVDTVSAPRSGNQASELGENSFLVQLIDVEAGERLAFTGHYFSSGVSVLREAGLTFWKSNGEWIADRSVELEDSTAYGSFIVDTAVPPETATVMVWVSNGEGGGSVTVDDLVLTREVVPGGGGTAGPVDAGIPTGGDGTSTGETIAEKTGGNPVVTYSGVPEGGDDLFPVETWPPLATGYYRPDGWTFIDYPYIFDSATEKWYRIESENPIEQLTVGALGTGDLSDFSGWYWFDWPFAINEEGSVEYFIFEGPNEFAIDLQTGEVNAIGSPGVEDTTGAGEVTGTHGAFSTGESLASGSLFYSQAWFENGVERNANREAMVVVPQGVPGRLPVVLLLHGSGMDPQEMLNTYAFLDRFILVSCRGVDGDWNVADFGPKSPDVQFIRDLILDLKQYENVDPGRVSLLGFSAGSGLINRMLIESDADLFANAIMLSQQLRHKQYHSGQFWFDPFAQWNYDLPITPAQGRRILTIHGLNDEVLPYAGRPGDPAWDLWLEAQHSTYTWAKAMGYQGPQLTYEEVRPFFEYPLLRYSYLGGQVVHCQIVDGDHRLNVPGQGMSKTIEIVREFLKNDDE